MRRSNFYRQKKPDRLRRELKAIVISLGSNDQKSSKIVKASTFGSLNLNFVIDAIRSGLPISVSYKVD